MGIWAERYLYSRFLLYHDFMDAEGEQVAKTREEMISKLEKSGRFEVKKKEGESKLILKESKEEPKASGGVDVTPGKTAMAVIFLIGSIVFLVSGNTIAFFIGLIFLAMCGHYLLTKLYVDGYGIAKIMGHKQVLKYGKDAVSVFIVIVIAMIVLELLGLKISL